MELLEKTNMRSSQYRTDAQNTNIIFKRACRAEATRQARIVKERLKKEEEAKKAK